MPTAFILLFIFPVFIMSNSNSYYELVTIGDGYVCTDTESKTT